jgi:hypothetical protein
MKYRTLSNSLLAFALSLLCCTQSSAATLSLDLDIQTPGIQNSRALTPGNAYEIGVVYTGDGLSVFDTFALDLVHDTSAVAVDSPVAGAIADTAPSMAFDIYGAAQVVSGDTLNQGNMPTPLGFNHGLGGVGVTSLGGMPFSLVAEDDSVRLFSAGLTARGNGASTLALTGYPFGVGAELSLAGESVPVTLEGATVTMVPVPAALWLFTSGVVGLFGIGRWSAVRDRYCIADCIKRTS